MNYQIKKYSPIIVSLFLISFMVYIYGCSSAESTTGKLAFKTGDYEKAERELIKGLNIDKNDDEGWYMLGVSQIELKKYEEGAKSLKTSLSISKSYASNITEYWIGKFNEGAKWFKAGIEAEKNQDSVKTVANYNKALDYFLAASYVLPDSLQSFIAAGECYYALGERDKALDVYQKILAKSKNEKDAIRVAELLYDAGFGMLDFNNNLEKEILDLHKKLDGEITEEEKTKILKAIDELNKKRQNIFEDAIGTFEKILGIEMLPKDNTYYEASALFYSYSKAKIGEIIRDANPDSKDHYPVFKEALVVLETLAPSIKDNLDLKIQAYGLLVDVYANLGENQKAQDSLNKKEELEKERDEIKE